MTPTEAADAGEGAGEVEFSFPPASGAAEAAVAAARRLITALLGADQVPGDEMGEIASRLGELADRLESRVPPVAMQTRSWATRSRQEAALRNPVNGRQNAIAPGLRIRGLADGSVAGDTVLGPAYEGPPGNAHGGVSALLLDHIFGAANFWVGRVGPTGELTVRYERPVPLLSPLTVAAKQVSAEGRKLRTAGTISADGEVCVRAEGLFIVKDGFGVRP